VGRLTPVGNRLVLRSKRISGDATPERRLAVAPAAAERPEPPTRAKLGGIASAFSPGARLAMTTGLEELGSFTRDTHWTLENREPAWTGHVRFRARPLTSS